MKRLLLILLVLTITVTTTVSQSGRRVPARATQTTSIPSTLIAEPDPEAKPEPAVTGPLLFVPERLRERGIRKLDSGSFRLADFEGKVLVINLWASWCGPCRREVPEYEKVRKAYANRDVEFIALTTENPNTAGERVEKFLNDVSFGFRLGWADADTASTLMSGKSGIPQTIVIGADNRVVDHWSGYAAGKSGKRLTDTIEHALLTSRGTVVSQ
jgi:thiol-disulfide isomerase/thioredoxin